MRTKRAKSPGTPPTADSPVPQSDDEQASRREQALTLKLSGVTDHQISRQLGYATTAEAVSDLARAYEEMQVLEPEVAKKLTVARINAEILRIERARAEAYVDSTPRERLAMAVLVSRAKRDLIALLAKVEGSVAPTQHLVGGEVRFRPVTELSDAELERIAHANGLRLLGPGGAGAAPEGEGED